MWLAEVGRGVTCCQRLYCEESCVIVVFGFEGFWIICQGGGQLGGLRINGCAASSFAMVLWRLGRAIERGVDALGGKTVPIFGDRMGCGEMADVCGEAGCAFRGAVACGGDQRDVDCLTSKPLVRV